MARFQFSASFSALPGRNLGTLAALILIASPVRGFRPLRAARLPTANVPNPTSDTDPPFFSVVFTAPIIDSSARVAAALEMSACLAMCSISSVLFTGVPPSGMNALDSVQKFVSRSLAAQGARGGKGRQLRRPRGHWRRLEAAPLAVSIRHAAIQHVGPRIL